MRIALAVVACLTVLSVFSLGSATAGASPSAPQAHAVTPFTLPSALFSPFRAQQAGCSRNGDAPVSPASLINLPAAGTGASATAALESLQGNEGVNTTVTAVSSSSLGEDDQFLLVGAGDPVNPTTFTAIGVATTTELYIGIAAPVAYLPNGTLVYNEDNTVSIGSTQTLEIQHVSGYWWTYKYGSDLITGSDAWENGTYNLGVAAATGTLCEEGYTVGPSFVALAYGDDGQPTPTFPTTTIPWAVGVETAGSSSINYEPTAANTIPELNTSLGTIGIQSHVQKASLHADELSVGSSVAFPGAFSSLWGAFKVVTLNSSTITPVSASLAYAGSQAFNLTTLDQYGNFLPGVTITWQFAPAALGTLNATTGSTVLLTAGATTVSGKLWANLTYNCSTLHDVANIAVTPTGGPTILSFTATPADLVLGSTTVLKVTNGTWIRPITYKYTGLPAGCTSANVTSLTCLATVPGSYNVWVFLNDSKGHSSSQNTTFTVYPPLDATTFTFTPSALTANRSTTVLVTATGGLPPVTYYYEGMPTGCSGYQPATFTCVPSHAGTFDASVLVNDSTGASFTLTATLTVNVGVEIAAFAATPNPVNFDSTTWINVTAADGTPPYSYSYTGLPGGCSSADTEALVCVPTQTQATPFLISVNVTDSSGAFQTGSLLLTVNPPPYPVISSFYASPNPVNVSQAVTFHLLASGGTGTLTYAYSGLPSGCTSSDTDALTCTPLAEGTVNVTGTVTDADGHSAVNWVDLKVTENAAAPSISSFVASPASVDVGDSTTLTVTASGGTGTLTYAYTGLPAGCQTSNAASITCTPSANGTFSVRVFVNDSSGLGATATLNLAVAPASSSSSSAGLGSLFPWILLVVVIAVVAVVAVVLMRRKKAQQPPPGAPPMAWQEPPPGPGAPAPGFANYPPAAGPGAPPPGTG